MKALFILATLLLSTSVFASKKAYELNLDLSIDGKTVASPKLVVFAGSMGSVIQDTASGNSFFEVVVNEGEVQGNKGILMKFKVGHILEDGSRKIISRPTILSENGKEASITIGEDGTAQKVIIKVTASRTAL